MTPTAATTDGISLSLQSLIDTRYEVMGFRQSTKPTGSELPGQRTGIRRGQGVEFLDLRQYSPGDDVRHIDWNVTARSNEPYTRLYRQEKELTTTVLVDLRPVMFNGSDCLRAVAAGHLAAATLWQSANAGDRCSSIVIDVDKISVSRPLAGNKGVLPALEQIATAYNRSYEAIVHPQRNMSDQYGAPQLSDAFEIISKHKRYSGSTFMFSGFDTGGDDAFDQALASLAQRGGVTATLLLDKLEQYPLPTGNYRYRYAGVTNKVTIDSTTRSALSQKLARQRNRREDRLNSAGVNTVVTDSTSSAMDYLIELQQRGCI